MKKFLKIWINFWGHRYRIFQNDRVIKEILIYHKRIYELEEKQMKMLERYNKLSKEDKSYLESFIIYREIYDNAKAKNIELSDDTVEDLKEYIMEFHDDYYNYDLSQMTNFISINYLNNKFT